MKAKSMRPSAAAAWASLFFLVLPLAYLAVLYFAYRRQAIATGTVDRWVPYFRILGAPGLLLCRAFGYDPSFWVEDAAGSSYWQMLVAFLLANLLGWLLLTTGLTVAGRWFRIRLRRSRQAT